MSSFFDDAVYREIKFKRMWTFDCSTISRGSSSEKFSHKLKEQRLFDTTNFDTKDKKTCVLETGSGYCERKNIS